MAAETSLLSKYLSTPKRLEHLRASIRPSPEKLTALFYWQILVITILGNIVPLYFTRQVFIFYFPNTTAGPSGRAV